jgi:ribonucleoside-diphosphate reductase beta chain
MRPGTCSSTPVSRTRSSPSRPPSLPTSRAPGRRSPPAFNKIFDEALVQAHDELVSRPGDLSVKVRFITIYHLILEATLGLTTFRFATEYMEREGLLPGFVEGYSHIHHDETRHIGYGVWFLRESARDSPEAAEAVRGTLRDLLPSVSEVLRGASNGSGPDFERLGVSTDEIGEFALRGLTRRMDIIGVPLSSL